MPVRTLEGQVILWGHTEEQRVDLVSVEGESLHFQYDWPVWQEYVLTESYRTLTRPFYTRMPFHYHVVPGPLRNIAARFLLGRDATAGDTNEFPGFPIEQGFELLHHVIGGPVEMGQHRRLSDRVFLTHDIDTAEGFAFVKDIAQREMDCGFRSLWNIVASGYRIDHGVLEWLVSNDFRVGLHGYNHDNKLAFLEAGQIRERLDQCRDLIERYRINSFRSPSWLRSDALYSVLGEYVEYDYSTLDTDIFCPGGVGGCLWTKSFEREGITVIPTTVPFDDLLLFKVQPHDLCKFWRPKLEWLRSCGGNIVVNTHPDPHRSGSAAMLASYSDLLQTLSRVPRTAAGPGA
jgi:hypothetical protein